MLAEVDVDRYLARLGFNDDIATDLATLEALQRAHMTTVPFENLDVHRGVGVSVDAMDSVDKIVGRGRGGWCFEANGAFALLLEALGFEVRRLGAAVLLGGPNDAIDHLALEVMLDEPYLVDVGFGESFIRPIALNRPGPQDGGTRRYELMPSPKGSTLVSHRDGELRAEYRFKRVTLQMGDFAAASRRLQTDPSSFFVASPFATRLLDGGPDRVTLTHDRVKTEIGGTVTETAVATDEWEATLLEWFEMSV